MNYVNDHVYYRNLYLYFHFYSLQTNNCFTITRSCSILHKWSFDCVWLTFVAVDDIIITLFDGNGIICSLNLYVMELNCCFEYFIEFDMCHLAKDDVWSQKILGNQILIDIIVEALIVYNWMFLSWGQWEQTIGYYYWIITWQLYPLDFGVQFKEETKLNNRCISSK